jgi:glycosyltransferase involved in cell wall biosynthesis
MPPDTSLPSQTQTSQKGPSVSRPIAILLCTFNGARFLPLQLASYEAQDFSDWHLFVSDDGSQDDTKPLLEEFQKKHGPAKVSLRRGPQKGFVANFLSLICDPAIESGYYALSDQDDVWHPRKLSRARSFLMKAPAAAPFVYCSRTRLIDEQGTEIGLSPLFKKLPHFRNALTQSIAGGNTMVFNEAVRQDLMRGGPDANAASHDWWIYLIISAMGGTVFYDSEPTVSYRVHSRNVIGSNRSAAAQLLRARLLWQGRFQAWSDMNVAALERVESLMTDENRTTFELFRRSRKQSLLPRAYGLMRTGIYRQTLLGNIGLAVAALTGRI